MPIAAMKIALCQYTLGKPAEFADYANKVRARVIQAAEQRAELMLFPEYGSLELIALQRHNTAQDLQLSLVALQDQRAEFARLFSDLSAQYSIALVAPTFPWQLADGSFRNRALVFGANAVQSGANPLESYQDKLIMTRFERERWHITAGKQRVLFELPNGIRFAIGICYDSEFPLLMRPFAEAGAELLLVPSCTDTWPGFHRVRTACLARALENQMFVVQAPLRGEVDYSAAIDINVGRAGVYAPMDSLFGREFDGELARAGIGRSNYVLSGRAIKPPPQP
jgi:predicted amidohydrolase